MNIEVFTLIVKKEDTYMVENKIAFKENHFKLKVDFSRCDFIEQGGGYVGIVAHQSALRKGELIKIPQYDRNV